MSSEKERTYMWVLKKRGGGRETNREGNRRKEGRETKDERGRVREKKREKDRDRCIERDRLRVRDRVHADRQKQWKKDRQRK